MELLEAPLNCIAPINLRISLKTGRFRVSLRSFHASLPHQQCGGLPGWVFSLGFNGLCETWSEVLKQETGVTILQEWFRLTVMMMMISSETFEHRNWNSRKDLLQKILIS